MSHHEIIPQLDQLVQDFMLQTSVMNLATTVQDEPYCATCYYAYEPIHHWLVFKSEFDTQHIENALKNPKVAGTIVPDKLDKLMVKGIQFNGLFKQTDSRTEHIAEDVYISKFPIASLFRGRLWYIELTKLKYTDNTPIVGKKIIWER